MDVKIGPINSTNEKVAVDVSQEANYTEPSIIGKTGNKEEQNSNVVQERKWKKETYFVHGETKVDDRIDGFKTFDGEIYLRDRETGVIRAAQKKVRGKKARKQEKLNRRFTLKVEKQ